jgi:hypothetical protein
VQCSGCGLALASDHIGPCPNCGDQRKTHILTLAASFKGEGQLNTKWQHIREYYDKHPVPLTLVLLITFGSPFLGLFLGGLAGVLIGLGVSVVSFLLGLRAVTKVREIREGS